jgi:hypothetical protein
MTRHLFNVVKIWEVGVFRLQAVIGFADDRFPLKMTTKQDDNKMTTKK